MSAHSTLCVDREQALIAYYMLKNPEAPSDEEIEAFLDEKLDASLYNVRISTFPSPEDVEQLERSVSSLL